MDTAKALGAAWFAMLALSGAAQESAPNPLARGRPASNCAPPLVLRQNGPARANFPRRCDQAWISTEFEPNPATRGLLASKLCRADAATGLVLCLNSVCAPPSDDTTPAFSNSRCECPDRSTPGGVFGAECKKTWTPREFGASLVAWYDPTDSTTIHRSGDLVDRIDDKSGNAHHMTQSGAARPIYSATAIMGFPGIVANGTSQFMNATNVSFGMNTFSAFALASTQRVPTPLARLLTYRANGDAGDYSDRSFSLLLQDAVTNLTSYRGSMLSNSSSIVVVGNSHGGVPQVAQPLLPDVFLRLGTVSDGLRHTLYVDNLAADPVSFTGGVVSPGTLSILARDDGTNNWAGIIGETLILTRDVSPEERERIHAWLARHWSRVLVVEGDSLPHAGPPAGSTNGYVYQYIPHAITSTFLNDIAVGGSNLNNYTEADPAPTRFSSLTYRAPFYLNTRVPSNKNGQQYVLYFSVTNNLAGGDLAAYVAAWGQYALDAKAAGFDRVVTSTVLSRTDAQSNDAVRNAFNAAITAPGWAAAHGIDAIADFASDPIMGVDAAPTVHPGYFLDSVHPNAAGNTRLEAIFRAAMNSL